MKRVFPVLVGACLALSALSGGAAEIYGPIKPFLDRYCVDCHGATKQKGEVRLDDFNAIDGALWSDIYDQISEGEMPPEDELHPSSKERGDIAKLVLQISRDEAFSIATGYRRLNRREYANTVKDLLGLKAGVYDPAGNIFREDIDEGFDTNADELVISNELLLEYLESAERSLRMALYLKDLREPKPNVMSFRAGSLHGNDRRYTTHKKRSTVLRSKGESYPKTESRRVTVPGKYRVTITAAGVDRNNYGKMKFPPAEGPIKMGMGVRLDSRGKSPSSNLIQTFDLQDEKFKDYVIEVWLEKGAYPWVGFLNGAGKTAASIRQAVRQRKVSSKDVSPQRYEGPGVEVTQFKVEGPLDLEWPPATYRTIFQSDEIPDFDDASVRDTLLERFVTRAFRRAVTEEDVQGFRSYLNRQHQKTGDWHEAFIKTYAAVMASHDFLYIKEGVGKLPAVALANRLSYFLWSTMPDAELFGLARSGLLTKSAAYAGQVERLLRDPRMEQFVDGFATQWLSLDILGTMPPDIKDRRYSSYHKRGYERAFREETLSFFRYVLFQNQPVGDFLDSDYTFINDTLANVYELPFKVGSKHQKVKLPGGSNRGGLLGQGSVLALTSNGVETLPVTRGHWVLDELLGMPPPAPPEEVPALVPDLNGVDTPRDQLVRHREDPACFECHKRMDPLGLGLENFDVIGRYRTKYETGPSIDSAGEIFGTKFSNVAELRKILRTREHQFAESLTIKLADYAKGRRLNRRDKDLVESVVNDAKKDSYRFQSLLKHLLLSDLMLER